MTTTVSVTNEAVAVVLGPSPAPAPAYATLKSAVGVTSWDLMRFDVVEADTDGFAHESPGNPGTYDGFVIPTGMGGLYTVTMNLSIISPYTDACYGFAWMWFDAAWHIGAGNDKPVVIGSDPTLPCHMATPPMVLTEGTVLTLYAQHYLDNGTPVGAGFAPGSRWGLQRIGGIPA